MDCKKIFNIINIIFFIIFLSIIFTGNAFTCYNSIRNGITGSNYEINKDVFYISKNILTLPIIIIIYFFLNNTKINEDKINFNKVKTSSFLNFLIKNTDLIPNKESIPFEGSQIPFLYLFNISSITVVLCPVIMILLLVPFYILKYLTLSFNIKTYSNILIGLLIGLFSFYLLLEILLYFDLSDQNNLFSKTIKLFYFLTIIILLIIISIYTYLVENENNLKSIQIPKAENKQKNTIAENTQQNTTKTESTNKKINKTNTTINNSIVLTSVPIVEAEPPTLMNRLKKRVGVLSKPEIVPEPMVAVVNNRSNGARVGNSGNGVTVGNRGNTGNGSNVNSRPGKEGNKVNSRPGN